MNTTLFRISFAILILVLRAVEVQAAVASGWDFSQYFGTGFLTTDGNNFVDTLPANYSNFDPTFNAGAESAALGTMYINGAFGSTGVSGLGTGAEEFAPATGSLASNLDAPVEQLGDNPFDSFSILQSEGQLFTNLLSMTANASTSVVFGTNLTGVPGTGDNWRVSFSGRTLSGTASVGVEFSTDGSSYSSFGDVALTDVDTRFEIALAPTASETGYVRMTFPNPGAGGLNQAVIDNVAISVPEPASLAVALSAILALFCCGAPRRA